MASVAPPVGAWIEIFGSHSSIGFAIVAPPVGAWIEIDGCVIFVKPVSSRSPRGSVD